MCPAAVWQQLVVGQKTVVELEAAARSERETLMVREHILQIRKHIYIYSFCSERETLMRQVIYI
jgi:hypothetical protein